MLFVMEPLRMLWLAGSPVPRLKQLPSYYLSVREVCVGQRLPSSRPSHGLRLLRPAVRGALDKTATSITPRFFPSHEYAVLRTIVITQVRALPPESSHAAMATQLSVRPREVFPLGEVLEGRRETVGATLARRATDEPKRVLQPFGERREALPTLDHARVSPLRVGEREVIEPMREGKAPPSSRKVRLHR
jgi:hypothetical protein